MVGRKEKELCELLYWSMMEGEPGGMDRHIQYHAIMASSSKFANMV